MDLIQTAPAGGKTTELIRLSAEHGYYIVAPTHEDCYRIHQAAQMAIPFPLTWSEWVNNQYYPYGVRGLLIDDLDRCLQMHSRVPIHAVSGRFET